MDTMRFAVPCLFGLEGLVGDELRRMDMQDVSVENGRVLFSGGTSRTPSPTNVSFAMVLLSLLPPKWPPPFIYFPKNRKGCIFLRQNRCLPGNFGV